MKIIINAFSAVKTACGFQEKQIECAEGSSVHDIIEKLFLEYAALAKMKGKLLFAVNEEYCHEKKVLIDGDRLAIFPPVSGG
jgi:molybdopterin converting factor small subunit